MNPIDSRESLIKLANNLIQTSPTVSQIIAQESHQTLVTEAWNKVYVDPTKPPTANEYGHIARSQYRLLLTYWKGVLLNFADQLPQKLDPEIKYWIHLKDAPHSPSFSWEPFMEYDKKKDWDHEQIDWWKAHFHFEDPEKEDIRLRITFDRLLEPDLKVFAPNIHSQFRDDLGIFTRFGYVLRRHRLARIERELQIQGPDKWLYTLHTKSIDLKPGVAPQRIF